MKRMLLTGIAAVAVLAPANAQVNYTIGTGGDYPTLNSAVRYLDTSDGDEPNRITFIDDGPFFEETRVVINPARAGSRELIIEPAEGVQPLLVLGGGATDGIYLSKQFGGITMRGLTLIPHTDPAHTPQAAIVIQANHEEGTSVTLENLLISSNDGNNNPIASADGLTEPVFDENTVSFIDEGIFMPSSNYLEHSPVHNITIRDVVISGLDGADSSDGIRCQMDGGPGSQLTIGPNVTISYNRHSRGTVTSASTGSSIQPGGHNNIQTHIVGTQEQPVRLINNIGAGIGVTHTYNAPGVDLLEWTIIANNTGAGITYQDRDSTTVLNNVTIANNGLGAITGPVIPPEGFNATLSNVIIAGNGDGADPNNRILLTHWSTEAILGTADFTASDSAIVLNGNYTLNNQDFGGDGIESDEQYTITLNNITNADPIFVSLDPAAPGFAEVTNPAYATAGPGSTPLTGGGTYNTTSVSDWSVY